MLPGYWLAAVLLQVAASQFGAMEGEVHNLENGVPCPDEPRREQVGTDGVRVTEHKWAPNGDGEYVDWPIVYPSLCDVPAVVANESNRLPGMSSRRIALVMRGDSFRGLSYAIGTKKIPFYCSDASWEIQRSVVKAQLEYIVKPFEAHGYKVDIYLSTYGCTSLQHVTPERAKKMHQELVGWYGLDRVVAEELVTRTDDQIQSTGVQNSIRLLQSRAPLDYQSVILWRFDIPPLAPMAMPSEPPPQDVFAAAKPECEDRECFVKYLHYSGTIGMYFADDWGWSWPGWFSNCAMSAFMRDCMTNELQCTKAMNTNLPASAEYLQQIQHVGLFMVYREDYVELDGRMVCMHLQDRFDGPSCNDTAAIAWGKACDNVLATVPGYTGEIDHPDECPKICPGTPEPNYEEICNCLTDDGPNCDTNPR
jgi:hypothetical protein